ncbi:hypothetical protein QSV34_01340 [Porticoccus sp. W117]|uniref:hypothetical protein n=1 Tax=Porticoccus sp. W117 TaxID=3054777 RepID=UPI0025986811|nr:hypothetical protein [Porticoccus sp. W117]MDM3869990.1 hypothetical protein [Porticoccus sp. W117]
MAKLSPTARILLSAVAAFVCYGGWTLFVNSDGGVMSAMSYALSYGGYSFVMTLLTTVLLEFLYRYFAHHRKGPLVAGIITCLLLYMGAWCVNFAAGTPNILLTILPGAAFSTLFVISYLLTLAKTAKAT